MNVLINSAKGTESVGIDNDLLPLMTNEQQLILRKLKGLSQVLSDYLNLIEESNDLAADIQEAIEAIHYYSRQLKEISSVQ